MLFAAACATLQVCLIGIFCFSCLTHCCGKHTDRVEGQPGDEKVQDDSWAGEMGLQKGLSVAALTWALLSDSQDALLTHTINQVCRQAYTDSRSCTVFQTCRLFSHATGQQHWLHWQRGILLIVCYLLRAKTPKHARTSETNQAQEGNRVGQCTSK